MTITLNGESHEVQPRMTVADLLAQLGAQSKHVAVEVNMELVPRARHEEHVLGENDRLEIVTLVGGG